jgi:heptosyltransferase I
MAKPRAELKHVSSRTGGTPRVLIVRLSAVGDCIQTLPLAAALRRHVPQARITWAVEKGSADIVGACPAIDELLVLPRGFARSPQLLWKLRGLLQSRHFEMTFDPQGLTKSGLVAWLSGAPRRIGFARPAARELNPWLQTELVHSREPHRVTRYLELLRPLGIDSAPAHFQLTIPPAALALAFDLRMRPDLSSGYVVLNPGAGWASKRWPIERFADVAVHLGRRGLRSLVSWGGERERELAEQIVARGGQAAILAPPTTLLELAAVLKHARFVVGSDTGPIHLAAAVGTPCVALFGASSAAACGPYGPGHIVLQAALDESPGRKRPNADNWALREITAAMVCAACDDLLAGSATSSAA